MRLVLASQSPRRKELLAVLGFPFSVVSPAVDETPRSGEQPDAFAVRVAREKGLEVAAREPGAIVVAADTIVTIDDEILGKPADEAEAVGMLSRLAGRSHFVLSAVCIVDASNGSIREGLDSTKVWFDPLTTEQILDYVRRENVLDKAGAYAIQGYAGVYIPRIEGNYFNVMGLPLPLVHRLLCQTLS